MSQRGGYTPRMAGPDARTAQMTTLAVLRSLTPPALWDLASRIRNGKARGPSYQGLTTLVDMAALHRGRFAEVFDAAYPLDPSLPPDGNLTRLRTYQTWLFAQLALRVPGDFVSIGVSCGVTPKVLYELVLKGTGRTYHLIDPFVPGGGAYCDDPRIVMDQFGGDSRVRFIRDTAPKAFPLPLEHGIAFAELDTGDSEAEIESIPYLVDQLAPGGVIVTDEYGWGPWCRLYDEAADRSGANIFMLPTGQGVLMRR